MALAQIRDIHVRAYDFFTPIHRDLESGNPVWNRDHNQICMSMSVGNLEQMYFRLLKIDCQFGIHHQFLSLNIRFAPFTAIDKVANLGEPFATQNTHVHYEVFVVGQEPVE